MGKRVEREKAGRRWLYYAALGAAVAVLVVSAFMLLRQNRSRAADLRGTWIYDSSTEYEFDGKDRGVMRVGSSEHAFVYRARGEILTVEYTDSAIETANYRFRIDGDSLIMAGEEGTTGGVYELIRLPEET